MQAQDNQKIGATYFKTLIATNYCREFILIMLPLSRRIFTTKILILFCLLMMACSKPKEPSDPNMLENFELRNGALSTTFTFPASYQVKKEAENLLVFSIKYPSLEEANLAAMPQPDTITFYIEISERKGRTQNMVEGAVDQFDPKRPGLEFRAGIEEGFDSYRAKIGSVGTELIYYVFKAKDGSLVSIEDSSRKDSSYRVERTIAPNMHIRYLIARPIGRDFVKIDEALTAFIKQHSQTNN